MPRTERRRHVSAQPHVSENDARHPQQQHGLHDPRQPEGRHRDRHGRPTGLLHPNVVQHVAEQHEPRVPGGRVERGRRPVHHKKRLRPYRRAKPLEFAGLSREYRQDIPQVHADQRIPDPARLPRFGQRQLHAAPAHDGSRLEPDARTRRRLLRRRPHTINQWGGGRAKRHCLAARLRRSDWVVAA